MLRQIAGRYQIRRELGSGASAKVYEAFDTGALQRIVAVKVFRLYAMADATSMEEHARFRQGARAAGDLFHPNIVPVLDFGEDDECAWIVMELVDGETLRSLIDRGERLDTAAIVQLMGQILSALQYTHSRGVVHRDIKPENIMLTRDRVAKITDFGIARIEDASMTVVGTMLGSPAYMAPEQVLCEQVDDRTDLWAAGVILYQLLTGERPFEGSRTTVGHKVLHAEPVLPSRTPAGVPPQFDAVVQKALAKQPVARFASATEFAEALRAAAARQELKSKPSPQLVHPASDTTIVIQPGDVTLARQRPPARRRPAWALPVAIVGAVGVLGVVGVLLLPETPIGPGKPPGATTPPRGSVPESSRDTSNVPEASVPRASTPDVSAPGNLETPRGDAPPKVPAPDAMEPRPAPAPLLPAETVPAPIPPRPPPSVGALPPDLRNVAISAGAAFRCGVVTASVSANSIVFRGIAPRTEIQAAQRMVAAAGLPPRTAEMQGVGVFDSTYCGVLTQLEESLGSADAPQITFAEPGPMPEGRVLQVQVQMPDWPAHLALFALIQPGAAGQLVGTRRNAARMKLRLTDPAWEVTAPFGSGLLIAVATDRPLFAQRRSPERIDAFAAALGPALQSARENGGRIAAQVIAFETVAR